MTRAGDQPRWIADRHALLAVARDIRVRRENAYPALIAAGKLEQADADAALRAIGAIEADWRRAIDRRPRDPAAPVATRAERFATMAAAERATAARAARDPALADYHEMVRTLLWWERHPLGLAFFTDFTIAARLRWPVQSARAAA